MGQGFSGEDVSRVIYLLLYLLVAVAGLRATSSRGRREDEPPPHSGLRGWVDAHPWAIGGAVWAFIIWGLLTARLWWLGGSGLAWPTLPLTVVAGFCLGWLLSLVGGRRP